ncbi:hypothetical protein [Myroides odoratus]|uniref:hypothetical protein n=1 Tax=Myroides odoratus TaxID=256 RepID=UPI0039B08D84
MTNKIYAFLLLTLCLNSCQSKTQEQKIRIEAPNSLEQPTPLLDPMRIDSLEKVLKTEYKKMREIDNINWNHGTEGIATEGFILYLDSISFEGKEEFYKKVKLDIERFNARRRKYQDERAAEENETPQYSYNYSGYDFFDGFQYFFPIVEEYLKRKAFKFPTIETYKHRMQEVFGFGGQIKNNFPLVKDNGKLNCFSVNAGDPNSPYDEDKIAFYGSDYLVLEYYFYNYIGYPFIYTSLNAWNGIPESMYKEQEMKDTKNWQARIKESIYHENNYLFNKSNASLNWLYLHDQEFLTMLYEDFGYYGDDQLAEFYIMDVKLTFERLLNYGISPINQNLQPSLFNNYQSMFGTYRPYDTQYLINKKLLEKFVTLTNSKEDYIYPYILQYAAINMMNNLDKPEEEVYRTLYLFLSAHLLYYNQQIYNNIPEIGALSPALSHDSALYTVLYVEETRKALLTYLKKTNYLGYADYPQMIENMRVENDLW